MATKKIELELYVFRKPDGTESMRFSDVTDNGTDQFMVNLLGACMGKITVRGEYEDIGGDPVEKLVEGLTKAMEKERADSHMRLTKLQEQIDNLLCLTHQQEAAQ